MKTSKYLCYVGVLVIGMALILNYMRFYVCYKELSNTDDSFIYIYTDSDLSEEIGLYYYFFCFFLYYGILFLSK